MKTLKYEGTNIEVLYEKLKNGLDVFFLPNSKSRNFYITMSVKVGSLDTELKDVSVPNGSSHFLEHKMFDIGNNRSAFAKFAHLGSSVNAFTTYDYTCYEVVGCSNFKENLNYMLDLVQKVVFTKESTLKEKNIIREEIKMYQDNPKLRINTCLESLLNVKDGYKFPVSGDLNDIEEIDYDDLMKLYSLYYTPSNEFLIITGNFKVLEALGVIKKNQSEKIFKDVNVPIRKKSSEPIQVNKPFMELKMNIGYPKLKVAYKMEKKVFKASDDVELQLYLDSIMYLNFGKSSNFLEKLSTENITANVEYDVLIRENYVAITLEVDTDYKEEMLELLKNKMNNLVVKEDDLERYKRVLISNFVLNFDDSVKSNEWLQGEILGNSTIQADILTRYKELNLKKCLHIIDKINTNVSCYVYIKK